MLLLKKLIAENKQSVHLFVIIVFYFLNVYNLAKIMIPVLHDRSEAITYIPSYACSVSYLTFNSFELILFEDIPGG